MIRFGLQYFFDNSSGLVEDVESQRFAGLADPAAVMREESRHLITTEERFALNINRTDFFNIGLGFEAPLRVAENFYINPLLEWTWSVPVNRQGYSCLFIPDAEDPDAPMGGGDGCLDKEGASAFPMNLTLGVRVQPPVDGLSMYAAADIGLSGTSSLTRELATNSPYNVMFGAAYAYDLVTPPVPEPIIREVERTVEVPALAPLRGRIRGTVVDASSGRPVDGAVVTFPGRELTSLVTDGSGRFVTYNLEPGVVDLGLSHQEYNSGACRAQLPDERPESGELMVDVRCDLQPLPRAGGIRGTLVADDGSNVNGANIRLTGPLNRSATSDAAGRFSLEGLPVGAYQVRVEAEGYLIKLTDVQVAAREDAEPRIILVGQPRRPSVVIRGRNLQIRRRINFVTNSAEIAESSAGLLAEIADVLIRNPNLRRVEIQGHTDDRGGASRNQTLSQSRADAVRTWLSSHGVQSSRLEARGYGQTRPLVPNITAGNRARNRRVQFVITDQAE
jgi:outer membrane protein OmpA-like peptidoglycan-associated protein